MLSMVKLRVPATGRGTCLTMQPERWRRAQSCLMCFSELLAFTRGHRREYIIVGSTSSFSKAETFPLLRLPPRCYGSDTEASNAYLEESEHQDMAKNQHLKYRVSEGDTLTSIASRFGTTVQSIAVSNEIADVDYVHAGKILLIPTESNKSGEVTSGASRLDAGRHPIGVESHVLINDNVVTLTENPPSRMHSVPFSFQSFHVMLALSIVLSLAALGIIIRRVSNLLARRHVEIGSFEEEKHVDSYHRRKFRRWQGILDDDRRSEEEEVLSDGRMTVDLEDEKLRQTYAQLESVYVKFLADSGLTKSGYWRGGVPPAVEEH